MSDRLRVLYLCGWPVGPNGEGAASFVHEQIVELSTSITALYVEHAFESIAGLAKHPRRTMRPHPVSGAWPASIRALRIHTVRLPTRLTHRTLLEDLRRGGTALARRLRRAGERVDLVHAHVVLPTGLIGVHVAGELGVPIVLQEHSGPFEMHLDTDEKIAAVREIMTEASAIVAVSQALATRMRYAVPNAEVQVIPNLVRTDVFRAVPIPARSEEIRLISVGGLVPVKNQTALIGCVAELVAHGVPATLTLVGSGPLLGALKARARELRIHDRVAFVGHLSREATARAIADSHIYVCSSEIETFGLAVAEALAIGRPVVTTACGGPEEIVEPRCGSIVASGESHALAIAVLEVAQRLDEFHPHEMHSDIDRRFGRDAFRTRVLDTYEKVLRRGQPRRARRGAPPSATEAAPEAARRRSGDVTQS